MMVCWYILIERTEKGRRKKEGRDKEKKAGRKGGEKN
jgi:hypothetical protein